MASIQSESGAKKGKLVALEGDIDTIATQLRLLPPSQKILVLPSLLENLDQIQDKETFNARSFIRDVHNIFTERTQKARSFLASSTDVQPRLVFTNGGSLSARSTCIARIAENVTDDNIDEAEAIFNEIVKDGVAGLLQCEEDGEPATKGPEESGEQNEVEAAVEDPTTAAMKAAESLDRVAAVLDHDGIVDDAVETQNGETTLAEAENTYLDRTAKVEDEMEDETPPQPELANQTNNIKEAKTNLKRRSRIPVREFIFTAPRGEEIRRTVVDLSETHPSIWDRTRGSQIGQLTPRSATSRFSEQTLRQKEGDESADDFDIYSPGTETFPSTPVVVYGEACLVDMQSREMECRVRKVQSVDRFFPSLFANDQPFSGQGSVKPTVSSYHLQPRPMSSEGFGQQPSQYLQTLPRTTFVRASQKTIRRSPTGSDAGLSSSPTAPPIRVFVDRGTDAEVFIPELETEEKAVAPFEPVFPIVEDLILNLTPRGSDGLFEAVMASYKNGSYPVYPKAEIKAETDSKEGLSEDEDSQQQRPTSNMTAETDDAGYERRHTYDPYAYDPDVEKQWPQKSIKMQRANATHTIEPPTPCMTPLPNGIAEKILDFPPFIPGNALSLQNTLRQVLSVIFPTTDGYSQHMYKVPAEMERFWKPVFEIDESGTREKSWTVDQIVALGCEVGVKQDFFSQISGQIEKLGTKRSGTSRSGKLDIRYCIANAMQNFPDLPPSSPNNPLLNPDILASLLIPQIEAYLATNISVRFLILHYTSAQLPTVLALQNLVGSSLLKVAGILDTLSSDPPPFSRPRMSKINPLSNEATMARSTSRRAPSLSSSSFSSKRSITTPPAASFSKANYVIPSTATDAEITLFLSGIWKPLMERSTFYMPELEPSRPGSGVRPITPRLHTPKSPTGASFRNNGSNSNDASYPPSSFRMPRTSDKLSRLTGGQKYSQSIASSVLTTTPSEKGRKEDREWENFYIADEDSDDDAYDKMILGREYKKIMPEVKIVGQKRNTKKALKWLGLA